MADASAQLDSLFGTTWVHAFEEDTQRGAVFRPREGALGLSRRPRERIELSRDGTARVVVGGPDDRLEEAAARWHEEGGTVLIRAHNGTQLRILEWSAERVVVQMGQ